MTEEGYIGSYNFNKKDASEREKRYAEKGMKWGSRAGRVFGGASAVTGGLFAAKDGLNVYEGAGTLTLGYISWNLGDIVGTTGGLQ